MNVLIADSGSTKTEWALISNNGLPTPVSTFLTKGLNPFYHTNESVETILHEVKDYFHPLLPEKIYFYGSGSSLDEKKEFLRKIFARVFPNAQSEIHGDLFGAARAVCGDKPGLVAILGTGSNSCYYDGKQIVQNIPSLGYILGDEGSGVYLGKAILRAFFYDDLPTEIHHFLETNYDLSKAVVLEQIYKKELPNRYIAGFAKITSQFASNEYIQTLLTDAFQVFIRLHLFKYRSHNCNTVGFVGTIAFEHQLLLKKLLSENGFTPGLFLKSPISQLTEYHRLSLHGKNN